MLLLPSPGLQSDMVVPRYNKSLHQIVYNTKIINLCIPGPWSQGKVSPMPPLLGSLGNKSETVKNNVLKNFFKRKRSFQ